MAADHRLTLAKVQQLKPETSLSPRDGIGILIACGLIAWGMAFIGQQLPTASAWPMLKALLYFAATFLGIIGAGNFYDSVIKRPNHPLLDGEIVARARELGVVPEGISRPLDRALSAYGGIQRLAAERAWERSGTRIGDYLHQARACMLGLLERGQHLGKVAATLERFQGEATLPEPYRPVTEEYRRHCERLEAAAALMEQAEARLSRALLAISADAPGTVIVDEPLREMTANFSALAETLETISAASSPDLSASDAAVQSAQPEQAPQQVGVRQ
jgi:hypothetical protein